MKKFILASVLFVSLLLANHAFALSFVTTRGALGAQDFIDWSQLVGGTSSESVTSNLGATATASCQTAVTGAMNILSSGVQGSGLLGDFAPGDNLLFAHGSILGPAYSIVVDFTNPVVGAGAQIEADTTGMFIATMDAYGIDDTTLLASFSLNGIATFSGDDSAMFMGFSDTLADIGAIRFTVLSENDINEPVINRLSLKETGTTPVPEPSTIFLLGAGLAGLGLIRGQVRRCPRPPRR